MKHIDACDRLNIHPQFDSIMITISSSSLCLCLSFSFLAVDLKGIIILRK